MLSEFQKFIMRGNVIDLAVGIIIGAAFTAVVNSLVNDIIMPPIGFLLGGVDFSSIFIALDGQAYPSLAAAQAAGAPTINIGVFINTIINLLIVGLAVFFIIKAINNLTDRLTRQKKQAEAAAGPTTEERLVGAIERLNELLDKQPKV
jgi:large conductance mechanosensitive channel